MNTLLLVATLLFTSPLQSYDDTQEQQVSSTITEATVFLSGAQVSRTAEVELTQGINYITFSGLSNTLNEQSISISTDQQITLLSLRKVIAQAEASAKLDSLRNLLKNVTNDIKLKTAEKNVLDRELTILMGNTDLNGDNEKINAVELRQAMEFFKEKLIEIEKGKIEVQNEIDALNKRRNEINQQINEIRREQNRTSAQIVTEIESASASTVTFNISYMVPSAGWSPSYDVRVNDIADPMAMNYKANIYQNTGIDWNDVKLSISSAQPRSSTNIPNFNPNYLSFYSPPRPYRKKQEDFSSARELGIDKVSGTVVDARTGELMTGVNVYAPSSSSGTTTDRNGEFSFNISPNDKYLRVSFIGYKTQEVPIQRNLRIALQPGNVSLDEVVVSAYGAEKSLESPSGVSTTVSKYQTSFSFDIEVPYSIKGDGSRKTVTVQEHELEADYRYYAIPKERETAYLTAQLTDWEELNLLPGQMNLYFEQTFVGRSTLQPSTPGDTLMFSLGKDDGITVERERIKEFSEKNFFGSKVRETSGWQLNIRNGKSEAITLELVDQIPVSTNEDIEVSMQEKSGATVDKQTGKVTWLLEINPGETVQKTLRYEVEYPSGKEIQRRN